MLFPLICSSRTQDCHELVFGYIHDPQRMDHNVLDDLSDQESSTKHKNLVIRFSKRIKAPQRMTLHAFFLISTPHMRYLQNSGCTDDSVYSALGVCISRHVHTSMAVISKVIIRLIPSIQLIYVVECK